MKERKPNKEQWHITKHGRRKGAVGCQSPLEFETFSKKGCFLSFEWEKTNLNSFGLPLEISFLIH